MLGIALVTISASLTMLGLELAVRIHRGRALVQSATTDLRQDRIRPFVYHPRLGWIPTPGQLSRGWTSNVDASSIRSNGRSTSTASRPILAVGDSFTFGNEVEDGETWAANLERILNKRVLNGGVGAYGIDQAFLRAELLLEQYDPDVVILAFISDDINRTEYSYYPYGRGWKPYFTYENGALSLRNVPVPQKPAPTAYRGFQTLRRALGYSLLADAVLDRIVTVLDLSTEMLKLHPNQLQTRFRLDGHYSPAMNRAVAEHIAAFLGDGGIRSLSESPRPVP
jgi:hypothetical protein